ncbi:MAG: HEAT repeat domain-containing protein [Candidatus Competibacteraceae bacterium]|nr:HEAT repeat domain-containing protein [Candidatus Competibacteraceae bacterium]
MGRIGHLAALPLLGRGLLDKEQAAQHGLMLDILLQLLRDPAQPEQQRADGRRYPRYQETPALQALPPLLDHDNPAIRARVVDALALLDAKPAETLLVRLLDDRNEAIRAQACAQLAQRIVIGVPGASLEPLTRALAGGRRELLLAAAEGLAKQQRPEALQPLLLAFTAGTDTERKRAIAALANWATGGRWSIWSHCSTRAPICPPMTGRSPGRRRSAGRAAGAAHRRRRAPAAARRLESVAREGSSELRWRALSGLRRVGDERSRTLLERLASDPYEDNAARQRAASELGQLGETASEPVLESLLHQRDANLRKTGLDALRRLYPSDATQVNLLALNSEYPEISQPAARFLARQGDPNT